MHNFRYYLALTLLLLLALSVRLHAAPPAIDKQGQAREVSRYLANQLRLLPHQTQQVYFLALEQLTEQQLPTIGSHAKPRFATALQRVVTPAQYARYAALAQKSASAPQLALLK